MSDGDVQNRFPRPLAWLAGRKWGRNLAVAIFTPLDKLVYRLTRGRRGLSPSQSVLLLTTTGRKTGEPRRVPVLYLRDGERFWVVASGYGKPRHPAWSSNLLANPDAVVHVRGRAVDVRARLASDEEGAALWPRLLKLYPTWETYATWTDRSFRIFCLERR